MEVSVFVHGFLGKDYKFLPKEIAIINSTAELVGHWILKAPYPYEELPEPVRTYNDHCTQRRHHLEWSEGESALSEVIVLLQDIFRQCRDVHTADPDSRNFIKKLVGNSVGHSSFAYHKFDREDVKIMCPFHALRWTGGQRHQCALNRVYQIFKSGHMEPPPYEEAVSDTVLQVEETNL